jgi:urease accessory protein
MRRIVFLILAVALCMPETALAHTGNGLVHGFGAGFAHPIGGVDHLLAMFAVGLLAAQLGGRALWRVPASFVLTMIGGSIAGFSGFELPGTEFAIGISVVAIAMPVALALGMPVPFAMALVALFAFFHGYAHGAELPAGAGALPYIAGFALATAIIHGVGIGVGLLAGRLVKSGRGLALRLAGGVVTIAGFALFVV